MIPMWENLFSADRRTKTLRQKLKENILFQDLSNSELKLVEDVVHLRTYRASEIVFRQGDVGVGMYLILKGTVDISVEKVAPAKAGMSSTTVTTLQTGDFFGDLALVDDKNLRSATAQCASEAELIGFFKPDLVELAKRNPEAGVKILFRLGEVLGARLRETTSKITEMKTPL